MGEAGRRKDRIDLFGAGVLIGFSFLMGLNQPLIAIVNDGLAPIFQAGLRSVFAFPLVLGFAMLAGRRLSIRDGSFWPGLLTGSFFSIEFMLLFNAIELTAVSRTAIFFYTMPFWVAVAAHFLIPGEQLTARRLLGLGLAIAGVVLALSEESVDAGPYQSLGDAMCLLAAICWAGIAIVARVTPLARAAPEMQLLYQLGVSAIVLVSVALALGDPVREPTLAIGAVFAFQVIVVVAVGFLTWFWVLSIYPASDMTSFSFLAPVFGVICSWALLGETISPAVIGALALVGIGIFLVSWKPRVRASASA